MWNLMELVRRISVVRKRIALEALTRPGHLTSLRSRGMGCQEKTRVQSANSHRPDVRTSHTCSRGSFSLKGGAPSSLRPWRSDDGRNIRGESDESDAPAFQMSQFPHCSNTLSPPSSISNNTLANTRRIRSWVTESHCPTRKTPGNIPRSSHNRRDSHSTRIRIRTPTRRRWTEQALWPPPRLPTGWKPRSIFSFQTSFQVCEKPSSITVPERPIYSVAIAFPDTCSAFLVTTPAILISAGNHWAQWLRIIMWRG